MVRPAENVRARALKRALGFLFEKLRRFSEKSRLTVAGDKTSCYLFRVFSWEKNSS